MQTQSNTVIKVIAAIVDSKQLTLYKPDGETVVILQGDPRLAEIVQTITPVLAAGPGSVAEVDIKEAAPFNPYREYEEQSGGKIRFFRVAKTRLANWLNRVAESLIDQEPIVVPAQTIGVLPNQKAQKLLSAAEEIIAHAQPVTAEDFHDKDVGAKGDSTMVAVVGNEVIGGVEKLKPQITRAVSEKSFKGFNTFMERLATVADRRRHSAEDLLKFLEKGDLPIADDGSIIIYKILKRSQNGGYVDCHTGKVPQKVGSYVCMDEKLVDPDRRNECSNGLHVARRQYVGNFPGDVVTLCKVKPEDVIAVPDYDANKMRVCGYHILFELSNEAFSLLKANRPFTESPEAQLLLGRAMSGDHDPPHEEVRITEQQGGGVKVTPLLSTWKAPETKQIETKPVQALPESTEDTPLSAPKVDPKLVSKQVTKAKAEVESRKAKAQRLFSELHKAKAQKTKKQIAAELLAHKQKSKVGWAILGLPENAGSILQDILS